MINFCCFFRMSIQRQNFIYGRFGTHCFNFIFSPPAIDGTGSETLVYKIQTPGSYERMFRNVIIKIQTPAI